MFAGPWGQTAYAIFNGILLAAVMMLFMRFTVSAGKRRNASIWLALSITYLYLFQNNSGSWYSIAGGMNYLFPMLPTLLFLLGLRKIQQSDNVKPAFLALLALLGFITGWSQECFSVPLSGALFILMLPNLRKIKGSVWVMAVALWIGTAILVFAPGNFVRLEGRPGLLSSVINGARLLAGTYLFWIMLAGIIVLRICSRARFREFLSGNRLEITILCVSLAFGMVANTLPQSFNGVSFFSALILFRLISTLPLLHSSGRGAATLVILITLAIICNQARIIATSRELRDINHTFVENYIKSPDGVMAVPETNVPADVRPFAYNWFTASTRWWLIITLQKHYTKDRKPLQLLEKADYSAYANQNEVTLTPVGEALRGEEYLWFDNNNAPAKGDTITVSYQPIKPTGPAKWLRRNTGDILTTTIVADSANLVVGKGNLTGIKVGKLNIKDITLTKHTEQ